MPVCLLLPFAVTADEISPEELRVGVVVCTNKDSKLLRRKEKEVIPKDVCRSTHSCPCCVVPPLFPPLLLHFLETLLGTRERP